MHNVQIIILAAGHGTRMQHELPKPLVPLLGKPMIQYLLDAIAESGVCDRVGIVVNPKNKEIFEATLGGAYTYILQHEQKGTGHAVAVARDHIGNATEPILVLYGDMPFVSRETIQALAQKAHTSGAVITMGTTRVPDFNEWRSTFAGFSRVLRNDKGDVIATVEAKDATPQQLALHEVNPAYLCFQSEWLWNHIDMITNTNAQSEYYLTDLIKMAVDEGNTLATVSVDPYDALGINTKEHLALCEEIIQSRIR
ncbi:MAG: NTP transferase domain-containing protein [Candidatus Pacebacteria bacterium]|nr:NTP transferase domain-containing protein [Candidatus Paceibacterota bacterium]MCD8507861.1 NTP transferase domain-containing protein [Candidatus Paceibacterota bacterium]MCD8527834.1 NTP transferase domain-containing protein [Candidatus Paceibacterota bacterium]MCD8563540.1 NTP transferase domain-containing protein [Candidatus Paceibacterota bacterium]